MIPVEVIAVVLDAETEAVRLRDVDATVVTEGERGGRGDASDLVVSGDLKTRARDESGAAFAGDAHEAAIGLGLRTAALREVGLSVGREDEMVGGNETPRADFAVDDADDALLALELGDVPDVLAQGQVVGTGGLADDLAANDELDGGLAGVVAAGDEEAEIRVRELHLG